MTAYIIRRLILIIPTLILVSIVVFFMIRVIPGSAIDIVISRLDSAPLDGREEEMKEVIAKQLGLDVPVHVQYGRWMGGIIFRGDLGTMMWQNIPITEELKFRLPITFELGILALLTSLIISFPIGIYSAIRQDTIGDYAGRSFAILCIGVPGFWLGTMVMVIPTYYLGWAPPILYVPFGENPGENLIQFIIPGVILGMATAGINMRMTRTMMLEVLRQDYIKTAWSKGLRERVIITRHALKNALIPVVTIVGLQIPILVGGTVIIETIFNLPGMGRMLVDATFSRDYTTLSGVTFVIAIFIMFSNLIVDLTYAWLDPRVRYR
jgi:peptide/nickel transport system permease protein